MPTRSDSSARSSPSVWPQITPLGERHLRTAVKEYTQHCHLERNHQGLDNELIEKQSDELHVNGAVECRERLGGVLKFYSRRAA